MKKITVVCPAYNEAENLPLLYQALKTVFEPLEYELEWIVVDDHSRDGTGELMTELCAEDPRVVWLRMSRNFGSHAAIRAGAAHATGEAVVCIAADMQDPPEVIARLIEKWEQGAEVVWAARDKREGESLFTRASSRLYYKLLRGMSGMKDLPDKGADMWLMDRLVVDALNADEEMHSSVTAILRWMGFEHESITYTKVARAHGKSKWSIRRKIDHAINTFVASTAYPLRLMTYTGLTAAMLGFGYGIHIIQHALRHPADRPEGWASTLAVVLVLGGLQMIMIGVIGEYLWRTYEESRRRPLYIIQKKVNAGDQESNA